MCRGADPCGTRDGEANVPVTGKLRVARVDSYAHPDLRAVGPFVSRECFLRVRDCLDREARTREDDEEGLCLAIDDDSAARSERFFEKPTMLCDYRLIALAEAVLKLGRALDVGE